MVETALDGESDHLLLPKQVVREGHVIRIFPHGSVIDVQRDVARAIVRVLVHGDGIDLPAALPRRRAVGITVDGRVRAGHGDKHIAVRQRFDPVILCVR